MACQNCGNECPAKNSFCAQTCREAFYNRMSKRGRVAMPLLLAWRAGRGSGGSSKTAFAELCAYADHCNAEDKEKNRPPMADLICNRANGTGVGWRERA
jgi:hypothetical protein